MAFNRLTYKIDYMPFGELFIDGEPLDELIEAYEATRAFDPMGGYSGIVFHGLKSGELSAHFEPLPTDSDSIFPCVAVLGCECGEVGCWPLQCKIQETGAGIIWAEFRQPHRMNRDYCDFGPFLFDPDEYRSLFAELERTLLIALAEYQS